MVLLFLIMMLIPNIHRIGEVKAPGIVEHVVLGLIIRITDRVIIVNFLRDVINEKA